MKRQLDTLLVDLLNINHDLHWQIDNIMTTIHANKDIRNKLVDAYGSIDEIRKDLKEGDFAKLYKLHLIVRTMNS